MKGSNRNFETCCGGQKQWGGRRQFAGRKRTCSKKVPFNRRINENILNILRGYAVSHDMTETQALESAILLQTNISKQKGEKFMKIAIPTVEGKLCAHFGHCETFTFAEVDVEKKEILNIKEDAPEEGISCQSASWIAEQGVNIVLAGGMGGRPMMIFAENGVTVVAGCPELPVQELVQAYIDKNLETGENACAGEGHDHQHCHGNHEHGCGGHHN